MHRNDPCQLYREGKLLEVYEAVAEMLGNLIEKDSCGGHVSREVQNLSDWMDRANDYYLLAKNERLEQENAYLRSKLNSRT